MGIRKLILLDLPEPCNLLTNCSADGWNASRNTSFAQDFFYRFKVHNSSIHVLEVNVTACLPLHLEPRLL